MAFLRLKQAQKGNGFPLDAVRISQQDIKQCWLRGLSTSLKCWVFGVPPGGLECPPSPNQKKDTLILGKHPIVLGVSFKYSGDFIHPNRRSLFTTLKRKVTSKSSNGCPNPSPGTRVCPHGTWLYPTCFRHPHPSQRPCDGRGLHQPRAK